MKVAIYARVSKQLFDALENLIQVLYADGPYAKDYARAERALASFCKNICNRHDGKWVK